MSNFGWLEDPSRVDAEEALILIPSLGTTGELFDDLVDGLSVRKHALAIVRVDLPGHGIGPLRDCVSLPAMAREVADAVAGMHADAVTVAGVSMGGAIALETAKLRPARLRGVAMINSGPRLGTAQSWARLTDAVTRSGMKATARGAAAGWFSAGFRSSIRARALLDDIPRIDPSSYVACCRALADYDGRAAGANDVPALLIATTDDEATPAAGLRDFAQTLPNSEYFELSTGRHLSLVEHSVAVEAILAYFLDRTNRNAALLSAQLDCDNRKSESCGFEH